MLAVFGMIILMVMPVSAVYAEEPDIRANRYILIETSMGRICFEIYEDLMPATVANFIKYVNDGFYDGLIFHRTKPGYVVQAGRYYPDQSAKDATYSAIPLEANNGISFVDGSVGMAHFDDDVNSATSQFFICDGKHPEFDANNAMFGLVVTGLHNVKRMTQVETVNVMIDNQTFADWPVDPISISDVSIHDSIPNFAPIYMDGSTDAFDGSTIKEDTTWTVNIKNMFRDDETPDDLTYTCSSTDVLIEGNMAVWTPRHGSTGLNGVTFTATDPESLSTTSPAFSMVYEEVNEAPFKAPGVPANVFAEEDVEWKVDLADWIWDEESNGSINFEIDNENLTLSGSTLTWTPTNGPITHTVVITAKDPQNSSLMVVHTVDFTCNGTNDPPVYLGGLEDQSVEEGSLWFIHLRDYFVDEERNLGMRFEASSDVLYIKGDNVSWAPENGDETLTDVVFTAVDPDDSSMRVDSPAITITVIPVDDPPHVPATEDVTVDEDVPFLLELDTFISDVDTDLGLLDISTDSDNVTVDDDNNLVLLYGEDETSDEVNLTVSDDNGEYYCILMVTVNPVNDRPGEPVFTSPEDGGEYEVNELIVFRIDVTDPDNSRSEIQVSYRSDLDGEILNVDGAILSEGTHVITCIVTDREGLKNSTEITIKVGGDVIETSVAFGPVYYSDGKTPYGGVTVVVKYPDGTEYTGKTGANGIVTIAVPPGDAEVRVEDLGNVIVAPSSVTIDGSMSSVSVTASSVTAPKKEATPDDDDGISTMATVAIVVIVVLIVVFLLVFLVIKKKKDKEAAEEKARIEAARSPMAGYQQQQQMYGGLPTQQQPQYPQQGQPPQQPGNPPQGGY